MVRADLARWIRSALDGYGSEGLIRALAIGDRSGLSEDRWRTLRVTGIAHLMAISGLHVGMAAGAAYWLALRAWALVPRAALLVPAPQLAGVAAMLAAFAYALLAGLALPHAARAADAGRAVRVAPGKALRPRTRTVSRWR